MAAWVLRCTVVLILIVVFSELPALGQQESVELLLRLNRGETLFYSAAGSSQSNLDLTPRPPGNVLIAVRAPIDVDGRYETRQAIRVLDAGAEGVMQIEYMLEDYKVLGGSQPQELLMAPTVVKVRSDGRVVERLSGPEAQQVDYFPLALPGRPVRVGESWTHQLKAAQPRFLIQGTGTFTLTRIDRASDGRVAIVRHRIEGTPIGGPDASRWPNRARGQITGETLWSVERGRPLKVSGEFTAEFSGNLDIFGPATRITQTIKGTFQQDLLAPESVAVPQVAPDLLIVPGKAIGASSIDMSVLDLSAAWGQLERRPPDPGFRAPSLRWLITVVGFVDPDNVDRLIGLQVSERRYRTEKGIGFGSSEGALLMAYGISPVRLSMTIVGVGGVRMLIYNDQGIAFAVTSDAEHAGRGPAHAPIGAVDWITIFPPGGAARIYSLP